jgi:hypothetical protein
MLRLSCAFMGSSHYLLTPDPNFSEDFIACPPAVGERTGGQQEIESSRRVVKVLHLETGPEVSSGRARGERQRVW